MEGAKVKTCVLKISVQYDENKTDPESIARVMDMVVEDRLNDKELWEEYGHPEFGEVFILEE